MSTQLDYSSIKDLAYQIWEERGRPSGEADDCWREAELRCREECTRNAKATDDALKASFPASDPPASRIPDDVPINAADKWEAAADLTVPAARLRMVREHKS